MLDAIPRHCSVDNSYHAGTALKMATEAGAGKSMPEIDSLVRYTSCVSQQLVPKVARLKAHNGILLSSFLLYVASAASVG